MGPDRLSDLPDVLLIKILSSLKAREVAQTCILSKRWRDIWASVPCLHFDNADFSRKLSAKSFERFKNFVSSFLLSFDETYNLDLFHLSCHGHTYFYDNITEAVRMWITQAVKYKPKTLKLEFSYCMYLTLPGSLYICDSLQELSLSLKHCLDVTPEVVYLPKLKRLNLCFLYIGGKCIKNILNGCPMLESLSVESSLLITKDVCFGNMKHLSMIDCRELNVLSSCVNVEVLQIWSSYYLMDLLKGTVQNPMIFHKLKRLDLGTCCMNCAFGTLSSLLACTPKLETLILWHKCCCEAEVRGQCEENKSQNSRETIEWYNCKCLKEVQIMSVEDGKYDTTPQLVERVKQCTKGLMEVRVVISYS
ncbi:F-box/FBD/LRR protein [Rhynchospora pubera]|uniref:F-box/FBD/LRR protein n=1 Tax=Rhynchospora pubera TaxID=906938 RepID=A0AAV8GH41_9POAL|nr:F-box/FBD/LRR protein [Rhynchospora pubera]